MLAWGMVLVVFGALLGYVLLFGLSRGDRVLGAFLLTFVVSQVLAIVVVQPLLIAFGVLWALLLFPALSSLFSWVPGLGALLSPPGGQNGPESATLSGRLEHVTLVQAAGAASGLPADHAMLAFSVVTSLASAMFGGSTSWRRRKAARAVATVQQAQASRQQGEAAVAAELEAKYDAWSRGGSDVRAQRDGTLAALTELQATAAADTEQAPAAATRHNAVMQLTPESDVPAGSIDYTALAAAQLASLVFSGRMPPPSSTASLRRQLHLIATYLARRCPPALLRTMAERYRRATADASASDLQRALRYFVSEDAGGDSSTAGESTSHDEASDDDTHSGDAGSSVGSVHGGTAASSDTGSVVEEEVLPHTRQQQQQQQQETDGDDADIEEGGRLRLQMQGDSGQQSPCEAVAAVPTVVTAASTEGPEATGATAAECSEAQSAGDDGLLASGTQQSGSPTSARMVDVGVVSSGQEAK